MAVVVLCFACDFAPQERGAFKRLGKAAKLHFGNNKAFVIAIELIDLKGVRTTFHKITALVYYASVT